ncbi:aldehyde dehydrogenase family protein [Paenibacillus sp. PvR052]
MTIDLFINNQDVSGHTYMDIRDPGCLTDVIAQVAIGNVNQANEAVDAAHNAFQIWRKTDIHERVERLLAAAKALEEKADELSILLVKEQGMLHRDTKRDLAGGIRIIRNTVEIAETFFEPERFEDDESWISIEKMPRGVVAAIVPWNAPIVLTMSKVAPALVSGNTIVVKPSPFAPVSVTLALKTMAAFFPPGAINVVHGEGEIGSALSRNPLVKKIAFTGGTHTGKLIMGDAAATVKNINLELGGNDPAIVLEDAKPEEIIPALRQAALIRSGQVCYAVKRIYVPENMYKRFFDLMCEAVDELRVGYGFNEQSTLAPLNNKHQWVRVKELIQRAKMSQAVVKELGRKLEPEQWDNGYYLLPVVIGNVEPAAEIVACEQFGPVIPLIPYKTEEQVIHMANSTDYGLCSSIWSPNVDRALRIARQIEAGTTFINSHSRTALGDKVMPFGGVKQSGIGRTWTKIGLAEYVEYHAISRKK